MLEEDPYFDEEFKTVFNKFNIPEADDFSPDVLEDTYKHVDMDIALPRDVEGADFSKVKKRLRDTNGIPIGRSHDNNMLDKGFYEVEYIYGHNASLYANNI